MGVQKMSLLLNRYPPLGSMGTILRAFSSFLLKECGCSSRRSPGASVRLTQVAEVPPRAQMAGKRCSVDW